MQAPRSLLGFDVCRLVHVHQFFRGSYRLDPQGGSKYIKYVVRLY